jgi:pseudouridine-5'-phosphate glycosidase
MISNDQLIISDSVQKAVEVNDAVVALESAVITHGLPYPNNLSTAIEMENLIKNAGALPATICLINGIIRVGLNQNEFEPLATNEKAIKVGRKDFAGAILKKEWGGTTVSGTIAIAHIAGIKVFATGGIGGIHRGGSIDVSADLPALSETPIIVVCAGAKAILDIPATREYLETSSVPVIGFGTEMFPAFYSVDSGLKVDIRIDSPSDIAKFALNHWGLGFRSSILITVPPPLSVAIPREEIEEKISIALEDAERSGISGPSITPFLLSKLNDITKGRSMQTNTALLSNNAVVAAKIALALKEII